MPETGKPAPSSLLSLNVILCERILLEADNIYSAIRIVDVLYFRRDPSTPIQEKAIPLHVLVMGKVPPEDSAEHSVQLILVRPDGEETPLGNPLKAVLQAHIADPSMLADGSLESDIAGGFQIRGEFNIVPRQVGRHYFVVILDGEVVARAPFTILELKQRTDI